MDGDEDERIEIGVRGRVRVWFEGSVGGEGEGESEAIVVCGTCGGWERGLIVVLAC